MMPTTRRLPVTLLVSALALAGFAGCKKQIDANKLQDSITSDLSSKNVTNVTVSCPTDKAAKTGEDFTCSIDDGGKKFTVNVHQKDDEGNVEWKLDGLILDTTKIVDDAKKQMPSANISCPKKGVLVKNGDTYTCPVTGQEGYKAIEISVGAEGSGVSWKGV